MNLNLDNKPLNSLHCTTEKNSKNILKTKYFLPGTYFTLDSLPGSTPCQRKRILELDDFNKGKCKFDCKIPPSQLVDKGLTSGETSQVQSKNFFPIKNCDLKCDGDLNLLLSTCILGGGAYLLSYFFTKDKSLSQRLGILVGILKFMHEIYC